MRSTIDKSCLQSAADVEPIFFLKNLQHVADWNLRRVMDMNAREIIMHILSQTMWDLGMVAG